MLVDKKTLVAIDDFARDLIARNDHGLRYNEQEALSGFCVDDVSSRSLKHGIGFKRNSVKIFLPDVSGYFAPASPALEVLKEMYQIVMPGKVEKAMFNFLPGKVQNATMISYSIGNDMSSLAGGDISNVCFKNDVFKSFPEFNEQMRSGKEYKRFAEMVENAHANIFSEKYSRKKGEIKDPMHQALLVTGFLRELTDKAAENWAADNGVKFVHKSFDTDAGVPVFSTEPSKSSRTYFTNPTGNILAAVNHVIYHGFKKGIEAPFGEGGVERFVEHANKVAKENFHENPPVFRHFIRGEGELKDKKLYMDYQHEDPGLAHRLVRSRLDKHVNGNKEKPYNQLLAELKEVVLDKNDLYPVMFYSSDGKRLRNTSLVKDLINSNDALAAELVDNIHMDNPLVYQHRETVRRSINSGDDGGKVEFQLAFRSDKRYVYGPVGDTLKDASLGFLNALLEIKTDVKGVPVIPPAFDNSLEGRLDARSLKQYRGMYKDTRDWKDIKSVAEQEERLLMVAKKYKLDITERKIQRSDTGNVVYSMGISGPDFNFRAIGANLWGKDAPPPIEKQQQEVYEHIFKKLNGVARRAKNQLIENNIVGNAPSSSAVNMHTAPVTGKIVAEVGGGMKLNQ